MTEETVPKMFGKTVRELGDRVAIRTKEYGLWNDISWNEYYNRAKYIGCALVSMGLKKGECVSIIGDNCAEWVTIDIGIQCVGGVSVGVYSTNATPQVEYTVNHAESQFFFVENEEQLDKWLGFKDRAPTLKKVIVWELEGLRDYSDPMVMTLAELMEMGKKVVEEQPDLFEKRMNDITTDDIAVLIYTSGTTGPPKGAMLTHSNVTWLAKALTNVNPMHKKDEVMSFLPLCHIFERMFSVFGHIHIGYVVNFIESPDTVTDNMREISPTVGYGVPRIWEKYASTIYIKMADASFIKRNIYLLAYKIGQRRAALKMDLKSVPLLLELVYKIAYFTVFWKLKERLGFDRLRIAYSGAAPISQEVLSFFQAIGVNIVEGYGQTEGTGVTCTSVAGRVKFGSVGQPIPGTEVKIAEDGEILVRSPSVFKGYYRDPESTAKTIIDGWLYSGDIGEIDQDGYLKITDRKKDIIVTAGGKNITPQYIENKLKASPYINDAIVIGDKRKYLSCLIMLDEDTVVKFAQDNKVQFSTYGDLTQSAEIKALIQSELDRVNTTLSRVEQPKRFTILPKKLYVEDGEVTPTMKVKRSFVNKAFGDLIEAMY